MRRGQKTSAEQVVLKLRQIEVETMPRQRPDSTAQRSSDPALLSFLVSDRRCR